MHYPDSRWRPRCQGKSRDDVSGRILTITAVVMLLIIYIGRTKEFSASSDFNVNSSKERSFEDHANALSIFVLVLVLVLVYIGRTNDFLKLLRSLCTIAHWKGMVPKVSKLVLFLL